MAGSEKTGQGAGGEGRKGGLPLWAKILAVPALLVLLYGAIVATDAVPALHPGAVFASGPVLDASSPEALERSVRDMLAALPEEEREEFLDIFYFLSWKGVDHAKGEKPDYMVQFADWHGYTAARLVARNRAARQADIAAIEAASERSAEEARLANVERGRGEVRCLEAEIAREPEIRAMLDKVDVALSRFSGHQNRLAARLPDHMPDYREFYVDADFVLTNRTGLDLGLVRVEFELFDRKDGSRLSRDLVYLDFIGLGDGLDPETVRIVRVGGGSVANGQTRRINVPDLFYTRDHFTGRVPSSAELTSNMRLSAATVALEDAASQNAYNLSAVEDARRELDEWQTYLERGY